MRRIALLALLLALVALPVAADDWVALVSGAKPGTPPAVRALSGTERSTVLEIAVPGFWAEKTAQGWRFKLPDGLVSMTEGRPELPFVGCTVALPAAGTPALVLRSANFTLPGKYRVRMAPRPEFEGENHVPPQPAAPGITFPEAQALVAHSGLWREMPVASLQIYPFRTLGDGTLVGAASRLVVEVVHAGAPTAWAPVTLAEEFRATAEATVANFRFVPTMVEPENNLDAPAIEYLVVANTPLASGVTALLDWRKRQGYVTELVTTTSTSQTTIKNLILTRYNQGKLKFVVLVGDYAQIPYYSWSSTYSDMWYACLTGGSSPDLYPDVGLGRLSGTSTSVISHQVQKILKYEQNPPAGTWFTKTILTAHREQAPGKYVGCKMAIASGCLSSSAWTTYTQYGHQSGVTNDSVSGYINYGVGLVNYRGHGSTTGWANGWCSQSGEYNISRVNALTNGDMTPIVLNINCLNGNFKSSCLQEAWLQAKDGAVASLGATMASYTTPNHDYDKTLYSAIFCDGLTNIYAFYYKAIQKIISMGSSGQTNARMYWWGGDACTNLWGRVPYTMAVSHSATINTGSQNVQVTVKRGSVAVNGAKVCLYKGTEVFAVGNTNSSGVATLSVNPTSTGTMMVTVTAKDYRPYMGNIAVGAGQPAKYVYNPSNTPTTGGANSWPFNLYTGWRFQFIIDQKVLGTNPLTITNIAFAPNSTRTFAVKDFQMRMGHTTYKDFGTAGTTKFATILGKGAVEVYRRGAITWACTTGKWSDIGLTAPFKYSGKSNVCVEIRYNASASGGVTVYTDASIARAYTHSRYTADPFNATDWYSPIPGEYMGPKHRLTLQGGFSLAAPATVSIGNTALLSLSGGHSASFYQIAASVSGKTPVPLGAYTIFLTPDAVFWASVLIGPPVFNSYAGILSRSGTGGGKFATPNTPLLVGITIYHAAISYDRSGINGATNTGETKINR